MKKQLLAQDLRRRQYKLGQVPKEMIDAISDDDIIDAYITCSECGAKQAEGNQLIDFIAMAENTDHFFDLCDGNSNHKFQH